MTKTYCDRCGKEIQGSKYCWIRHKTRYAVQRLIPSSMRDDWTDTDKYICPDCEEQYIHWFMNHNVPAVPLDKLCEWLEVHARTPIYNMRHTAEWWKEELEKLMEGQDDTTGV